MNSLLKLLVSPEQEPKCTDGVFRQIVDMMKDPVLIQRFDGAVAYANPASSRLFGFSVQELLTIPDLLRKAVHTEYRDRLEEFWHAYRETGTLPDKAIELAWSRRDGRTVYTENLYTPIQDRRGRPAGFLTIARDITQRKLAEKALLESELRYNELFNSMLNGYCRCEVLFDREGRACDYRYLDVNPAFEKITGRDRESIVGRTALEVYGFVPQASIESFGRVAQSGRPEHFCGYLEHFDKNLDAFIYSPQAGQCVAVFIDASEKLKAEARLAQSEEKHRRLIDALNDGVFIVDIEGRVTFSNKALAAMCGRSDPSETIGMHFLDFVAPLKKAEIAEHFNALLRGEETAENVPNVLVRPDGSTLEVEIRPVPLVESGRIVGACGAVRDVSQQRLLELQLIHAQKMEAVGRLAGGVAHDFNNILTTILGYAQIIRAELKEQDPLLKDIVEIEKAGERASRLTRQLLAFSRKQVLQPRVLSLSSVISDTKKMLGRLIGENIELVTRFDEEGSVKADPGQIEQVLMNLAVNSRDAMPYGGRLTIETRNVDLTDRDARRHHGVVPGRYVMLAVTDTGCGMTRETLSHLFEPFFTTKEAGKGTGLGLSTVYGIVKQSGGNISAYSEPGRGTTFKIYLPRVEASPESRDVTPPPTIVGDGKTVLVVEDDSTLRSLVARSLQKKGYVVMAAENADEAERLSEGEKGPIHLLLTDIIMPGATGLELAHRILQLRDGTKALLMSGYTALGVLPHVGGELRYPFIQKPFTPEQLVRKVAEVLA